MAGTMCLFWKWTEQRWTTQEDFSPYGGSTYTRQWFAIPAGLVLAGVDTFQTEGDIQLDKGTIKFKNGSYNGANHSDTEMKGELPIDDGTDIVLKQQQAPLQTDDKTRYPYVEVNSQVYVFIPCVNFQLLAGRN